MIREGISSERKNNLPISHMEFDLVDDLKNLGNPRRCSFKDLSTVKFYDLLIKSYAEEMEEEYKYELSYERLETKIIDYLEDPLNRQISLFVSESEMRGSD